MRSLLSRFSRKSSRINVKMRPQRLRGLRLEPLEERRLLAASGVLQGTAFIDTDLDNHRDPGEAPKLGATIELRDALNAVVASYVTAADGYYRFDDVAAGTYTLVEIPPVGFTANGAEAISPVYPTQILGATIQVTIPDSSLTYVEYLSNGAGSGDFGTQAGFDLDNDGTIAPDEVFDFFAGQFFAQARTTGPLGTPGPTFTTFCMDFERDVFPGDNFNVDPVSALANLPNGGRIAYLYNHYGSQIMTDNVEAEALQLAIYELLYDPAFNTGNPGNDRFVYTGPNTQVAFYLADSVGKSETALYLDATFGGARPDAKQSLIAPIQLNFANKRKPDEVTPGIDIEKTTNGPTNANPVAPDYDNEDAMHGPGVPVLTPGSTVTWTYKVTNTGNLPFAFNEVVIVDDNGTPGNTADDLSTTGGQITFSSVASGDADNILEPGEVWLYQASSTVLSVPAAGSPVTFTFSGNSTLDGPDGNIRSLTASGISVNASAFSRDKTTGAWSAAYLGAYSGGLGVTDSSEGAGSNNSHTVDNVGRDNYVLFEFSEIVIPDSAFLGYVVTDSDITVWIGTVANAFASHVTLSDAVLTNLGFTEVNLTDLTSTRTADFNAGNLSGNVLVISAWTGDTTPDDQFKINKVIVREPGCYENKAVVTVPGDSDSDLSHYCNPEGAPGIDIEKTTNGPTNSNSTVPDYDNEDAANGAGVPILTPGSTVNWTYKVTNTGNVAFAFNQVVVVDDNGTPSNAADDLSTTGGQITFASVQTGDADNVLEPGEVWLYKASGTVLVLSAPASPASTFDFSGNSALDGADGNVRTFTSGSVSVKASGFSRDKSTGAWSAAFLGSYGGGLGVTDNSEGDGSSNMHTVDNVGRDNYVLFELSESVVVDSAFLGYVVDDSDLTVWIGTIPNAFNSHQTLSDSLLASLGFMEVNLTDLTSARTADFNAGNIAGNVVVIAAHTQDDSPEDRFKIEKLTIRPSQSGVYQNKATVIVPGDFDSDLSHYKNPVAPPPAPGIDIEKTTNGSTNANPTAPNYDNEDAANGAGVPILTPGSTVNWTYKVTNTGNVAFAFNQVVVIDDNGTPSNAADDLSTTGGQITFASVQTGDADNVLEPGEVWLYKASGTVLVLSAPASPASTFDFSGNSALDGTDGNVRTFTSGSVSVKASGFSRDKSTGAWSTAFLGSYGGGLGVTDNSEGDGSSNMHTVDNVGRDNYVLFELSESVVVDSAFLGYVVDDSDLTVWIGTIPNAFNSHQTLSDSLLASLGFKEVNLTDLTSARTADFNAGNIAGNVVVIAAHTQDDSPEDRFKIEKLTIRQSQSGIYQNKSTVTVPGDSDSDLSHYKNPAAPPPAPGIDIEKSTNGPTNSNPTAPNYDNEDAANGAGVPILTPGSSVNWTYKVTNTGNVAFASSEVVIVDDNGTPSNSADDLRTATGQITFVSVLTGDTDSLLEPGEVWLYKASGTVQNLSAPGAASTFDFSGTSATDGTDGNVRTFTSGSVSVKASGFSRDKSSGAWSAGFLGSYGGGLGVTDNSEGSGADNMHTVDNSGRDNYVLFEFSESVIVDTAFLGYVVNDSDLTVWIGTIPNAFNSHQTLSDSLLASLGFTEVNLTDLTAARMADLNAGNLSGNVLVIAAYTEDASPEDRFKIEKVTVRQSLSGAYQNKATVTVPGGTDSDLSHYKNTVLGSVSGYKFNDRNADGEWDKNGLDNCLGTADDELPLSGWKIFVDYDNDGVLDANEPYDLTDSSGYYRINGVNPGVHAVDEVMQAGWIRTTDEAIVNLTGGGAVVNVNFGNFCGNVVMSGDSATVGFWKGTNGQKLIKQLNGGGTYGTATALGNWLASNFGEMYGAGNNLAGKTNAQIASYFTSLANDSTKQLEAQVLATVLAVYVTNSGWAGGTYAASYGFTVTSVGVKNDYYNIGDNGAAFGVVNDSALTVWDILQRTNARASNGSLWYGYSSTIKSMAKVVYTGINAEGSIS